MRIEITSILRFRLGLSVVQLYTPRSTERIIAYQSLFFNVNHWQIKLHERACSAVGIGLDEVQIYKLQFN